MPQIPMPPGFVGVENLPKSRQTLMNCFNNQQGAVIARPGIETISNLGTVARGQFVWNGALYEVVGTTLIKITNVETGTFTTIGTIAGNTLVESAVGFTAAVLVVRGGEIYSLDTSDTLTDISGNANYEPSDAVTFIDARFVFIPSNGANPAFFTDANALTVGASNFFDAEELPDQNTTTFNLRNTLYIAGTDSFELFRNTGATPVPFSRLTGARLDYGYIGGLVFYNDTYAFVGRERDQDPGIYLVSQGRAIKISNERVDLILSQHTLEQLSRAVGNRFKWRGYDILTITLTNASFGFFNGQWFELTTIIEGEILPWNGGFIDQFEGTYYSASGTLFGKIENIDTEFGNKIPRIIDVAFQHPDNDFFACQSVSLQISQGFDGGPGDDVPGTVGLALSRNNVEYGEYLFRDLGALGDYTDHLEWNYPGGLGTYDGFMGLRIYTTQSVDFNSNGLFAFFRG